MLVSRFLLVFSGNGIDGSLMIETVGYTGEKSAVAEHLYSCHQRQLIEYSIGRKCQVSSEAGVNGRNTRRGEGDSVGTHVCARIGGH